MLNRVLLLMLLVCVASCTSKVKDYTCLDDAAKDKIGVLMGSSQDEFITKKYLNAEIVRIDMSADLISSLKAGNCDVAIFTTIEAVELLKVNPDLEILEDNFCSQSLGVGFNKNNTDLRDEFNTFLAKIKSEGLYDQIIRRWTKDIEDAQIPEIVLPKTGIPLKIGTTATSVPFSFDKNGKLSGIDIEIITRFAASLNRPVEFQKMNFSGLIPALISDKEDVIINSIIITEERAGKVAFSNGYFQSTATALVKKKDKASVQGYRSINDLSEKRIGVLLGSTHDSYVTKKFPKATIVRIDMISDMFLALKNDKCDVIVLDDILFNAAVKDNSEISVLDENLFNGETAVGFSLNNAALRDEFNNMLAEFRNDSTYDQIYKRWMDGENPVMPKIDIPKTGIPLRVGITASSPPFDYYMNKEPAGFDVELVTRFAQRLKRPIEFQIINFGGLIAALSSGKVDLIAVGITITPEHSKNIAFANPHYSSKNVTGVLTKNLAGKPIPKGYATKEDLKTKRIAVLMGSTHDAYAVKNFPQAKIAHCDSYADVVMELVSEKCEAALFNTESYAHMKKSHPQIELLDSCLFTTAVGIGFSYTQNDLKEEFNAFLKELQNNKTLDEIVTRWRSGGEDATMPTINIPTSGKSIRVAVSGTSIPFSFIRNGEHAGIDIELLLRFAQSINRPIEFSAVNFGGLIAALSSGKVDVIASSIMITSERAKQVNFSDPYFYNNCVMAVLGKNLATKPEAKGYATKEDLRTKRIAVLTGTTHDAFITKKFPEAKIIRCDTYADALMDLTSEKCDATMFSKTSYNSIKKSNPQVVMLDSVMHHENSGMGFSYKQNELKEQFNSFLKEIRESKLYDQIYNRWISDCENAVMPDIEIPTSGKPIRVGVSGASVPFTFIQDGKHTGLDVELMLRFAKSINRPIEFSIINFSGLISAIAGGKVDVITDLSITEERAKSINFSDPYFLNYGVMLVLEKNLAGHNINTPQKEGKQGFFVSLKDSFYNNIIAEKRYILILNGLWYTLLISVFAALLGTIFGALVCFMRMSKNTLMNAIAKTYTIIMRGIPVLVLLMLLYYAVFAKWDINASIVAIITFALNFAAYVSEMFRTSIEGVDRGQSEAGIAMGFTKVKTFIFIVMPQAIKSVLPVYKGELISLIKMTSVVGYIAVEDLTKASDIIRSRTFDAFFPLVMVAIIYFLLAWAFTAILDKMNKKMTSR